MNISPIAPATKQAVHRSQPQRPVEPQDTFQSSSPTEAGIYSPRMFVSTSPPSKVQQALGRPEVQAQLGQFSSDLQARVRTLSDAQLGVLKGGMRGETKVGPFSVNNREAFIKGSVMGKSIWGNVHGNIKDACHKHNMITPGEEQALHKLIDGVSGLSREQRQKLATLLDRVG